MYYYQEEMVADIISHIKAHGTEEELRGKLSELGGREELETELNDELWNSDSVTGNASGSYTFNSYKAAEYVVDNTDILQDAICEFGIDAETVVTRFLNGNWEWFDVTIRCYLLGECISEALDRLEEELEEEPE